MTFEMVTLIQVRCDNCRMLREPYDEGVVLYETPAKALDAFLDDHDDWTEDGHGRHHCGACPTLTLDPRVIIEREAEAARKLTGADVPLIDLEPVEPSVVRSTQTGHIWPCPLFYVGNRGFGKCMCGVGA